MGCEVRSEMNDSFLTQVHMELPLSLVFLRT
jgi:hypothetical protein